VLRRITGLRSLLSLFAASEGAREPSKELQLELSSCLLLPLSLSFSFSLVLRSSCFRVAVVVVAWAFLAGWLLFCCVVFLETDALSMACCCQCVGVLVRSYRSPIGRFGQLGLVVCTVMCGEPLPLNSFFVFI